MNYQIRDRLCPVEMVQSIRHELEDAYEYMRGICRDIDIIYGQMNPRPHVHSWQGGTQCLTSA